MDEAPGEKNLEKHVVTKPAAEKPHSVHGTPGPSRKSFWGYVKVVFHFCYLWLLIGFSFGTFLLLIPVRSLVGYLRIHAYQQRTENIIMTMVIIGFVVSTFLFAKWIRTWLVNSKNKLAKYIFHAVLLVTFIGSLWFLLTPKTILSDGFIPSTTGQFVAGPYPTKTAMLRLKEKGFTGIVSLLSPLVVPFEPILLEQEEANAKRMGLKLIHIPLLPWVGQNNEANKRIIKLAKTIGPNEKYYVHCYLGQDRIWMFLTLANQVAEANVDENAPIHLRHDLMTRGYVLQLDSNHVIGPMPTATEFPRLMSKDKRNVSIVPFNVFVSLYSKSKERTKSLAGREKEFVEIYGAKFHNYPIKGEPYNPQKILEIANKVKKIPGRVYIYDYLMPNRSSVAEGFILSYKTGLPAIPKILLKNFTRGPVTQVAPNIVLGPNPTAREVGRYLKGRGFTGLIYVGPKDNKDFNLDKKIANYFKILLYQYAPDDPNLLTRLGSGGPWYVYGPELETIQPTIEQQYDHLMPKDLPFYKSNVYRKRQAPEQQPPTQNPQKPAQEQKLLPEQPSKQEN